MANFIPFYLDNIFKQIAENTNCSILTINIYRIVENIYGNINLIHSVFPGVATGLCYEAINSLSPESMQEIDCVLQGKSLINSFASDNCYYEVYLHAYHGHKGEILGCICVIKLSLNASSINKNDILNQGYRSVDPHSVLWQPCKIVCEYLRIHQFERHMCYNIFFGFSAPCPACPVIEEFRMGSFVWKSCRDSQRQKFLALSFDPYCFPKTDKSVESIKDVSDASCLFEDAESASDHERAMLMLDSLPICCGLFNNRLEMVDCNRATVNFFQCSGKIETCERIFEMFPERQPDGSLSSEAAFLELNKAFETGYNQVEWTFLLPDGSLVPAEVIVVKISCGDSDMLATYTRDLRHEKALRAAHDEANELIRLMFEAIPICCNLWDDQYNNIECNMEAVKLFDLSSKSEYLVRFFELSPEKQPCGEPSVSKAFRHIRQSFMSGYNRFEWIHKKLDGELIPAEVTLVRINRGDRYIVAGYTRDLRKEKLLKEAKEAALQAAQRDPLTRLYNKTTTQMMIEDTLVGPDSVGRHAIVCIDLDNFKAVNDKFGHLFGDQILVEISEIIKSTFRSDDIIGRFGGDEFIVFIRDILDCDVVKAKLDLICSKINKIYKLGDMEQAVSASIGVALYPDDGARYVDLYHNADYASYYAKKLGKNRYIFWKECMNKFASKNENDYGKII